MNIESKVIPLELHPMGFIEAFVHFGADLDALLEGTGITRGMFGMRGIKISYSQQKRLLLNGVSLCNTPGLGLKVGMYMDWSYNGSVGNVVTCSPSLKDAGAAMRRYLVIAQPHYIMYARKPAIYVNENGFIISPVREFTNLKKYHPELQRFEMEYRVAVTARIYDMCGNKSVEDPSVYLRLNFPRPSYAELYDELPVTEVKFDCEECSIAVHYKFMTEPWRQYRKANYDRVIAQCEEELKEAKLETTYDAKVRWHVSLYYNQPVTLEHVAEQLSLTPRALTRKLAAEGTSFRSIVHDVRMEIATFHLQSSNLSVDEVAELMGFSSASSLRRAVKNWTGETISELRAS